MTAYYVRDGLVVRLNEEKTYKSGETVDLTEEQYKRHAHQVETVEQYKARTSKSTVKKGDK